MTVITDLLIALEYKRLGNRTILDLRKTPVPFAPPLAPVAPPSGAHPPPLGPPPSPASSSTLVTPPLPYPATKVVFLLQTAPELPPK